MFTRSLGLPSLASAVLLSGCAGMQAPTGTNAPIPIADFVDSLKCDYANYIVNYSGKHLPLRGWPVTGTMDLNVLAGQDTTASAGAIIPFQGGSATLGISYAVARKKTVVTTISFMLDPRVSDTSICDKVRAKNIEAGIGFGDWLYGVAGQLDAAVEGEPKFGVTQLDYQLVFAVERKTTVSGGLKLSIVSLSLSADQAAYRNDVQTIKIKIEPNDIVVGHDKKGKPIKKKGVKLFSQEPDVSMSPLVISQ